MSQTRNARLSGLECDALARQLREELARRRMTRQALADAAKLSISTLEKALSGRRGFTLATLVRLETALGQTLLDRATSPPAPGTGNAPDELGNYNRASVSWLEGSYLTIRPSFGEPGAVYAYRTDITWNEHASCLDFREAERVDQDFIQFGKIAVPYQSGHIYFVTNRHGQHRLIVVARPAITGEMHGLLITLQLGRGSHLTPVATPVVLKPIRGGADPAFGRIGPEHRNFAKYSRLLSKTLDDNFAALLPGGNRVLT